MQSANLESVERFRDRRDAGRRLGEQVATRSLDDVVVLGLPRGGVPVAYEVAHVLGAPLDVFVARKVGAPGQPEFGIGAVAEAGGEATNDEAIRHLRLDATTFASLAAAERDELARRVERYRGTRPLPAVAGRDVVLVDDGLATGVTAEAALRALQGLRPRRLLLAVPVCASESADRLGAFVDEVVCALRPRRFYAVGEWYDDFSQTTDEEVLALLPPASTAR